MPTRIIAILCALLFAAFAVLQLNDPDPVIWVTAYGAVSALWAFAAFGRWLPKATQALLMVLTVWMIFFIPDFVSWVGMGMPNIAGSMKAEEPHIELVREFGGLFLAVISLVYLLRLRRGKV